MKDGIDDAEREFDPENRADDKLYTPKEVAEIFRVTAETVRDWIAKKKIPAIQIPNKQFRIKRKDLVAFGQSKYGSKVDD